MSEEFCAIAYSSTLALSVPKIVESYRASATHALGNTPDRYTWKFIPKDSFWFHDTRNNIDIYAERDLVELCAFHKRKGEK